MALQVLLNSVYWVGTRNLTSLNNKIEWDWSAEVKEKTTFGDEGAKRVMTGVETVAISAEGFLDHESDNDPLAAWFEQRRVSEVHIGCPETAAVGALSYLTMAVRNNGKWFGGVGDPYNWSLGAAGDWPVAEGKVLYSPGVPVTADADGTAVELAAVGSGQRLYAAAVVASVAGTMTPELDLIIESDSVGTFDASPETRLSFGTYTTPVAEAKRTAKGAHADTFYRARFAVEDNGGTGASFLCFVVIGID